MPKKNFHKTVICLLNVLHCYDNAKYVIQGECLKKFHEFVSFFLGVFKFLIQTLNHPQDKEFYRRCMEKMGSKLLKVVPEFCFTSKYSPFHNTL